MNVDLEKLVKVLLDKEVSIGERDDAAMDLSKYDDDTALRALIHIAKDKDEDFVILNSCGESIGAIWVKRNTFDKECYEKLSEDAQYGIYYVLREDRPKWLDLLKIKWK